MDRAARPGAPKVGDKAAIVERVGNVALAGPVMHESTIDFAHDGGFVVGTRRQQDAIRLDALLLAAFEAALDRSGLIHKDAAQPEPGRAALPEAEFDQTALAGKDLGRQLPAIFAGHGALDALDDGRD